MKKMYRVSEVAEILDYKPYTVRKMMREQKIKATKIGRQWRISEEELQRLRRGE